jgi:hypothetical protein
MVPNSGRFLSLGSELSPTPDRRFSQQRFITMESQHFINSPPNSYDSLQLDSRLAATSHHPSTLAATSHHPSTRLHWPSEGDSLCNFSKGFLWLWASNNSQECRLQRCEPCGSCKNGRFGRRYRLHHQGENNQQARKDKIRELEITLAV